MKVLLTAKEDITAKDGREFVKLSFVTASNGVTGDVFITKDKYEALNLGVKNFVSAEDLAELVANLPSVDIEFDQRGRMVTVS